MEVLSQLGWVDLVIIMVLAAGVFFGFTQGLIRYALNALAVVVAFIVAAQLKGPIHDLLGFWTAFTFEGRELLIFVLLFFGLVIGAWFTIRALYRRTRLPIVRQADELGGAVLGLLFVVLVISLHLVVYDTYFRGSGETGGWVASYYGALNDSLLVAFFRESVIPAVGFVARPFVPDEVARFLAA